MFQAVRLTSVTVGAQIVALYTAVRASQPYPSYTHAPAVASSAYVIALILHDWLWEPSPLNRTQLPVQA